MMNNSNFQRTLNHAFCQLCQKVVELKNIDQAADVLKAGFNEIKYLIENFQLHRINNSQGKVRICAESLFEVLERRPTQRLSEDLFKTNPSGSNIFIGDIL